MKNLFVRKNGVFGGVCGGLADRLQISVLLIRVVVFLAIVSSVGLGLLIYFCAVVAFPNELSQAIGDRPQFLGVCHKLGKRLSIHEAWLRFCVLLAWIFTGFLPVFAIYIIAALVLSSTDDTRSQGSSGIRDVN